MDQNKPSIIPKYFSFVMKGFVIFEAFVNILFRPKRCKILPDDDANEDERPDQTFVFLEPSRPVAERIFAEAEKYVEAS